MTNILPFPITERIKQQQMDELYQEMIDAIPAFLHAVRIVNERYGLTNKGEL